MRRSTDAGTLPDLSIFVRHVFFASMMMVVFALCACGGGSSTSFAPIKAHPNTVLSADSVAPSVTPASTAPVPVTFNFVLPSMSATTEKTLRHLKNASYNGYTSGASTPTISLTVTPFGGSASGPYTGTCISGSSGTCTVTFTATPGLTTFSGTLSEAGNVVANFSQMQVVQPTSVNAINFTANPVVSSVSLQLATTSINAGTQQDVTLTVLAKDANNNTIAGTAPYVDINGKPIAIMLQTVNAQNGGQGSGTLKGALRITSPLQSSPILHYDGNWLDHTTVTATTTSSSVNTASATATLKTVPYAKEYSISGVPMYIVTGADGNLWVTDFGNSAIGKMTTKGTYTSYSCSPCANLDRITMGPDGNVWFIDGDSIYKVKPSGTVVHVLTTGVQGHVILLGPDGNIWYSSSSGKLIGKVSPSGVNLATYSMGVAIVGIGFAADESLWYTTESTTIGHISLSGASLGTSTIANAGFYSYGVVAGPDGNIWIANFGSNQLDKVTPTGIVTPIALQAAAEPINIIVGPDGNLWFAEASTIGYVAPGSTTPTEYTTTNGISATTGITGLTVGPDGNIWFTETDTGKIVKFVW